MILYILIGSIVIGSLLAYFILMVFFPEWVGITGKKALDYQKSHDEDKNKEEKIEADKLSKFFDKT